MDANFSFFYKCSLKLFTYYYYTLLRSNQLFGSFLGRNVFVLLVRAIRCYIFSALLSRFFCALSISTIVIQLQTSFQWLRPSLHGLCSGMLAVQWSVLFSCTFIYIYRCTCNQTTTALTNVFPVGYSTCHHGFVYRLGKVIVLKLYVTCKGK